MGKKTKTRGGGILDKIKNVLGLDSAAETVQKTADSTGITDATADVSSTLGVAPESGTTTTGGPTTTETAAAAAGGRRRRRTMKSKKGSKKTMRRKH